MDAESQPDDDSTGTEIETLQDTLGSEQITFVDDLSADIRATIEDTPALQRYEYVIGDVSDYGISSKGHAHFELVHEDTPLHCVLYEFRRTSITVDIKDGRQLAIMTLPPMTASEWDVASRACTLPEDNPAYPAATPSLSAAFSLTYSKTADRSA